MKWKHELLNMYVEVNEMIEKVNETSEMNEISELNETNEVLTSEVNDVIFDKKKPFDYSSLSQD